jgi:phosphohistidine phosphatase
MEVPVKLLSLLRHAKSSWKDAGIEDHDRPLNKRGQRDAPRMGLFLREKQLIPELILSSTARRARDTALKVTEACGYTGEVRLLSELYLAEPERYLDVVRVLPETVGHVMLVGHNPGLEQLLERLVGEAHPLPTAALAVVELPVDRWEQSGPPPTGELRGLWLPKELDG